MIQIERAKKIASTFVTWGHDYTRAAETKRQADKSWDEALRIIKETPGIEDDDREIIIGELEKMGKATPLLVKNVHRAFNVLSIAGRAQAETAVPNPRTKAIIKESDKAVGKKKGRKIRTKKLDALLQIETPQVQGAEQSGEDRKAEQAAIFEEELLKAIHPFLYLLRYGYDIMSIEQSVQFYKDVVVPFFHSRYDDEIALEKAQIAMEIERKRKQANGGNGH